MRAALAALLALAAVPTAAALPVQTPQVVRTYPHDPHAFTEGLFFHNGHLYESTGLEGRSFIRKEDLATGRVLKSVQLPPDIFGEGIAPWGKELISVTWHGGLGFRWSLASFRKLGTWRYEGEGWAMTQDGRHLILSDGTPVLRFLDPKTLKVVKRLTVTADGKPLQRINELEYVKGEILANVWMTNDIVRIDPATGKVKGVIDASAIVKEVGATDPDAVLNGIAYDKAKDRLFITGKDWPKLFEIRLPEGP